MTAQQPTDAPAQGLDDAARVLRGLDPEQAEAAAAVRGPVCILAGAGTGKTRAITHRIAYSVRTGAVPPEQLLAVTFTARAAGEMRSRLARLGVGRVQARTFHSAALRQLTYFAPQILGGPLPDLIDNPVRLVAQVAARARLRTDRTQVRDLASEIDWAKAVLASPAQYAAAAEAAGRIPPISADAVAAVYRGYEDAKDRGRVIDFADLLLITATAIESMPQVAAQIRGQYRHFVVDEYQDVSPLQQRLLEAWVGDRDDLCVVGDANQTIYSFAGATPEHLLSFPDRYGDAVVVRLERDYRSTPQVVALANKLVAGTGHARLQLIGQRPDGPAPTFAEHDDEPAEAASVAKACRALIDSGTPPAEIAVLFRINAQSEVYEQALSSLAIPYVLRGGERFFDRPEIREARLLLRGAARAGGEPEPLLDTVRATLSGLSWHAGSPPPGGAARERWESLAALVALAEDVLSQDQGATIDTLVNELDQRAALQHAPTVQGVTLASLHAAKGLEWDVVYLVGLVDGTLPIQHAKTEEQIAEERRLLYVGITRARERLHLSWALARAAGQRRGRKPSRFLDTLRTARRDVRASRAAAPDRKAVAADAELFGRLRAWRRKQSEAQEVPAYVVFSDATLVAIADARPCDLGALGAVPGVGPTKLARYADPVLEAIAGGEPEAVDI